jgi:DNA ligase-1
VKPMLAATVNDLTEVVLPAYVSPKMDGIRCLIKDGIAVSRTLKPIPNKFIQEKLKDLPEGLDGELMVKGDFNDIQSAVMSVEGEPKFFYVLFDIISDGTYIERYQKLCDIVSEAFNPYLKIVQTILVENLEELERIEQVTVKQRFEGIMLRGEHSIYKQGRSTLKEQHLLKFKRFIDDEAVIVDFKEKMHNTNEAETDALGHTKRSTKAEGKIPAGTTGAIVARWNDHIIEIGPGFDAALAKDMWENQEKYLFKLVTFKYQELTKFDEPRFPSFKGFRKELDENIVSES